MEPAGSNCSPQPSTLFLLMTLIVTVVATAMLCAAIMSEHWEYVNWDKEKLRAIEKDIKNSTHRNDYELEWLLDGQVVRVVLDENETRKKNMIKGIFEESKDDQNIPALFFVPIQGGIWIFCINVTVEQHLHLSNYGFPKMLCTNYLRPDTTKGGSLKADWQHRMQNLSISCALVCLIILGSSALIGAFGVTKHQISAVLVTGVMYLLAATFATFSLTIIHFKRSQSKMDCFNGSTTHEIQAEGVVVSESALLKPYKLKKVNKYFEARIFLTGWSMHLGWGGAGMCILVSIFWILLSKIMRYNPLNTLLAVL